MKTQPNQSTYDKRFTENLFDRIDIQVMTLMTIFTFFSTMITATLFWQQCYNIMLDSLEARVYAIYGSIESLIDPQSFVEINNYEDYTSPLYIKTKDTLLLYKNASEALYLYTAKMNDEGHLVYVVDGLEVYEDFRFPGDLIEAEIEEKMMRALNNEHIIPKNILDTEWGYIFVSYLPMHDETGEVIGVIGVEFDATVPYMTYKRLQYCIPVIIILFVLLSACISLQMFRRISNPLYINKSNIDSSTGFKNRNAYNTDFNNLMVRKNCNFIGIIVADINGLKEVNDRLGHISGDDYIKLVAGAIQETKLKQMIVYRTGGDEFAIIMQNARSDEFEIFIRNCSKLVKSQTTFNNMRCSLSCGYAIFDKNLDNDLEDTYHRADNLMYEEKRRQKEERTL